jgi:hypothetical protein
MTHAVALRPNSAIIQFNVARYKAQFGNSANAKAHLSREPRIDKEYSPQPLTIPI